LSFFDSVDLKKILISKYQLKDREEKNKIGFYSNRNNMNRSNNHFSFQAKIARALVRRSNNQLIPTKHVIKDFYPSETNSSTNDTINTEIASNKNEKVKILNKTLDRNILIEKTNNISQSKLLNLSFKSETFVNTSSTQRPSLHESNLFTPTTASKVRRKSFGIMDYTNKLTSNSDHSFVRGRRKYFCFETLLTLIIK
jgi:hypothetical protein